MLTVKSLGKFEMSDGVNVVDDEVLRSDMLKKLLLYLLTHREYPATTQVLSEALWYDDEIDNPTGALKNLMYRLRNIMKKIFGDENYILTSKGAYAWNTEIKVQMDVECFEELCKQAKDSEDKALVIEKYEQALALYKGEFMDRATDHHWMVTLSTYYHSMFLKAAKALAELYMQEARYQDVERVSVKALEVEKLDEELYAYHIMALIKENEYDLAVKRYEEASNLICRTLGVRNYTKLQAVEKELLKMSKGNEAKKLEKIHDELLETEETEGGFLCGYQVFQEVYRLEVRKSVRHGVEAYIVLLTLELAKDIKADNHKMEHFLISQGMRNLEGTLKTTLRMGDVISVYSDSQFIVLLSDCTEKGSVSVVERIQRNFASIDKGKKIQIKAEYERISERCSALVK